LALLHEDYISRVNLAIAEDRDDLIPGLVDAYTAEALRTITAGEARRSGDRIRRRR
jgi:hypothetical protein